MCSYSARDVNGDTFESDGHSNLLKCIELVTGDAMAIRAISKLYKVPFNSSSTFPKKFIQLKFIHDNEVKLDGWFFFVTKGSSEKILDLFRTIIYINGEELPVNKEMKGSFYVAYMWNLAKWANASWDSAHLSVTQYPKCYKLKAATISISQYTGL